MARMTSGLNLKYVMLTQLDALYEYDNVVFICKLPNTWSHLMQTDISTKLDHGHHPVDEGQPLVLHFFMS